MSEPETPTQPLIGAPSQQTAINVGAPEQSGRSTRAYKVAGLTLLACVLIMSQAMIAYFLLSQKNDIKSLEEQSNNLRTQLTKGRSVAVPMQMHLPMNALPGLTVDIMDKEAPEGTPDPVPATNCQLEAAGAKRMQVPGFHPSCDEHGLYRPQQCYMHECWCVDPISGNQIPGTATKGQARCGGAVLSRGSSKMLTVRDINV